PITLQPDTWIGPARLWATVTPVMLPQYPRRGLSPEQVLSRACQDAGYPPLDSVRIALAPMLAGVPQTRSFYSKPRKGRPPRPMTHARIRFNQPVRGPVLLGAGRYAGFGVCRPIQEEETR